MDDIRWWADGKGEESVAAELSRAAAASIDWAASNGVAFDHRKTEGGGRSKRGDETVTAAIFRRKNTATVKAGANTVPFNKEATRWLESG